MKTYFAVPLVLIGAMFGLAASGSAQAVALPSTATTYDFSGTCSDCNGTGRAHLTLENYTQGNPIDISNFVSFSYEGTNLLGAFAFSGQGSIQGIEGMLPPSLPSGANFMILSTPSGPNQIWYEFVSGKYTEKSLEDPWVVGLNSTENLDYGNDGVWSTTHGDGTVPEPDSIFLLIGSLAALGFLRRSSKESKEQSISHIVSSA